jgi:HSP20 family protein
MATRDLMKFNDERFFPSLFTDFFKPWNNWFDDENIRTVTVPSVNVTETDDNFKVSLAAPGLKKEDFIISVDGNIITISAETKSEKEEKDEKFTRKEYNYQSFRRSFTLPEMAEQEKIEAKYEDGELKLLLPKKTAIKKPAAKQIAVN